ncbi:hypothetical protein [Leptospira bouyouniensis]|uniref:DUF2442 domain-containing protein n=1 Tax=Leptospira bouyouniensis TaxID=2484911 RepID=A0ABY2L2G9_9LEPT|nr:hypothetical protein [Leptospira bouyouniensis]TGK45515.1 hypothetical protein EHQ10_18890 [Leptospira bouyouniensis]
MYRFRVEPFKVILIPKEGKSIVLETVDGTGIFMSAVLDQVTERFNSNMAPHVALSAEYNKIKDKALESLSKEEKDLLEEYVQSGNRIAKFYNEYCSKALKDWDLDKAAILDKIPKHQLNVFVEHLVAAVLGGRTPDPVPSNLSPEELVKKNKNRNKKKNKKKHFGSSPTNGFAGGVSTHLKFKPGINSEGTGNERRMNS